MKISNVQAADSGAFIMGLKVIEPDVYLDARGHFMESFNRLRYMDLGLPEDFVQDNWSRSKRGVLRGLHLQYPNPQGKLVQVIHGAVWDVAVDLRWNSPTYSKWFGLELSDENRKQLYIPPGFAHGFCVLSEEADFVYKCTQYYTPGAEQCLRWDDPSVNIKWPIANPILSDKDQLGVHLKGLHLTG